MKKKSETFRTYAHQVVDWMADYYENIESYPVKSQVEPGEIARQIGEEIPLKPEDFIYILKDFEKKIIPGITHWQHPNFYAYFQANSSIPSVLAEMLCAGLGIQGMKWETSPASTELEEKMMNWLQKVIGIPQNWHGVIQDSASSATLVSLLTAREQKSNYQINENGYKGFDNFRVYCSTQTHSSIEKGVKIAGMGRKNLVKIPTNEKLELRPDLLEKCIKEDIKKGFQPLCIVAALGTTGTLAMDPLEEIADIAEKHKVWLHVDAAYAGSALVLPEYQSLIKGIQKADSFVFNPHKWLFTNFDCSVYFIKNKTALINTFSILPEYLKTQSDGKVSNHCDWGIPLGRRFRSLKLWFVLRYYGLERIREMLRYHIQLAEWLEKEIQNTPSFRLVVPRNMNLVCFHYCPEDIKDLKAINKLNERLLHKLNATGKLFLTHTKVKDIFTLRMSVGQTDVHKMHVENSWKLIRDMVKK